VYARHPSKIYSGVQHQSPAECAAIDPMKRRLRVVLFEAATIRNTGEVYDR
jgi:hypothetical protein